MGKIEQLYLLYLKLTLLVLVMQLKAPKAITT